MKDDSFWMVVEEGKPLSNGIRCEGGKDEAKEVRKRMSQKTGRSWTARKTTQKEVDAEKRSLQPV